MSDLIKRISNAKGMIEKKPNQSTVDYTIYGVLTDCDITLKSQQAEIERLHESKKAKHVTGHTYCRCGNCGVMLMEGWQFCAYCGKKIEWD